MKILANSYGFIFTLLLLANSSPALSDEISDKLKDGFSNIFKQLQAQNNTSSPSDSTSNTIDQKALPQKEATQISSNAETSSNATSFQTDLVGVKLGMTVNEVSSALNKYMPGADIIEVPAIVPDVPSSNYVSALKVTKPGSNNNSEERINVLFPAPQNSEKAVAIFRYIHFAVNERTTLENLVNSLKKKYGKLSYDKDESNYGITSKYLIWVWSQDGSLRTVNPYDTATLKLAGINIINVGDNLDSDAFKITWLRNGDYKNIIHGCKNSSIGCSTVLSAKLTHENGLVTIAFISAIDIAACDIASANTEKFVAEYKQSEQQKALDKANSQKGPAL
ncbi:MAG: hypothetical protein IPM20_06325 [Gammaproteobacteria bacterium]|nr:hypothetical protein [Gammaproteobacteria bacterium]